MSDLVRDGERLVERRVVQRRRRDEGREERVARAVCVRDSGHGARGRRPSSAGGVARQHPGGAAFDHREFHTLSVRAHQIFERRLRGVLSRHRALICDPHPRPGAYLGRGRPKHSRDQKNSQQCDVARNVEYGRNPAKIGKKTILGAPFLAENRFGLDF